MALKVLLGFAQSGLSIPDDLVAQEIKGTKVVAILADFDAEASIEKIVDFQEKLIGIAQNASVIAAKVGTLVEENDLSQPELSVILAEYFDTFDNYVEMHLKVDFDPEKFIETHLADRPDKFARLNPVDVGHHVATIIERMRDAKARQLRTKISPWCHRLAWEPSAKDWGVTDIFLMLPRDEIDEVKNKIRDLIEEEHGDLLVRIVAPLPIYNFAPGMLPLAAQTS